MADDCGNCFIWTLVVLFFSPLVLQYYGVANSEWVVSESCLELHNKPSCCDASNPNSHHDDCRGSFSLSELSEPVYIVQVTAAILLTLSSLLLFCTQLCAAADGDLACCKICNLSYPASGLLSIIGCIMFAMKYPDQKYDHCFKTCLASGLLVIILSMFTLCCDSGSSCKSNAATQPQYQQVDRVNDGEV